MCFCKIRNKHVLHIDQKQLFIYFGYTLIKHLGSH